MQKVALSVSVAIVAALVVAACGDKTPPPATPTAAQPGQPGYQPQPGQPGYGQPGQPGYAQPGQPGYPPPGGQPGYPPPGGQPGYPPPGGQPGYPQPGMAPAGGQLAVPGPMALPCQSDQQCMTHKCNTQYGKCTFPCETDNDCIMGSYCFKGVPTGATCLPKAPGQQ